MSVVGGETSKGGSQSAKSTLTSLALFSRTRVRGVWWSEIRHPGLRLRKGKGFWPRSFIEASSSRLSGISVVLEDVMGRCRNVCPEIHMCATRAKLKDFYAMLLAINLIAIITPH